MSFQILIGMKSVPETIDASKINKELGWQPQETFESGIQKTVEWYLNNLEWCRHVQDGSYQRERLGVKL